MRRSFYPTKYASLREALSPRFEKASSWVREHRRLLSWVTTLVAVAGLTWTLSAHGRWASLTEATLTHASWLVMAVLLWPLNLGLEAWKWRRLSSDALDSGTSRSWTVVWKEVLVGQTWALLGPFRLADGAGRLATVDDPRLKSAAGAKAFALGAASQGWATWFFAVPALALAGFGLCAGMLGLVIALVGRWLSMSFHGSVAALSLLRYVTFATQYLLMLSAWNVLDPTSGFPRVSPHRCGVVCGGVHSLACRTRGA